MNELISRFLDTGLSLSLAESCTGGLFCSTLVCHEGVSRFFKGGVVAYSNDVKQDLLGVPSHLLKTMGAVSLPVAKKMACGVRKKMGSDWSLAVSGIAGPDGGSINVPVGRVCFGVAGPGVEYAEQQQFSGVRLEIQHASVQHGVKLLLNFLK